MIELIAMRQLIVEGGGSLFRRGVWGERGIVGTLNEGIND